jgi:hypothetical protein
MIEARAAAAALGGDVAGRQQVICPGPGHSKRDRSLSVRLTNTGFIVHSFAGDDPLVCRDHVRARLGLGSFEVSRRYETPGTTSPQRCGEEGEPTAEKHFRIDPKIQKDEQRKLTGFARSIWNATAPAKGTLVERYLEARGLALPETRAIRFHPRLKVTGTEFIAPAMVCAYCDIKTNEFRGVHRTWLSLDAKRIDRATLGPTKGAAIKIDGDESVTEGLAIAEGVESTIAARYLFRPAWAVISAGGMQDFPVLAAIEHLEIFADNDASKTGERAALACQARWEKAGAEVSILMAPEEGTDIADFIKSRKVY